MSVCFCIGQGCPSYYRCFPSHGAPWWGTIPPFKQPSHGPYVWTAPTTTAGVGTKPSEPIQKPKVEEVCRNCRCFYGLGENWPPNPDREGECRCNPPTGDHQWPKVQASDWCDCWERIREITALKEASD